MTSQHDIQQTKKSSVCVAILDDTFWAHTCRRLLGAVVGHMGNLHKSANSSVS